jgi:hypothetical protein
LEGAVDTAFRETGGEDVVDVAREVVETENTPDSHHIVKYCLEVTIENPDVPPRQSRAVVRFIDEPDNRSRVVPDLPPAATSTSTASDVPGTPLAIGAEVSSTIDVNTKPRDVYAIELVAGQEVVFALNGSGRGIDVELAKPGAESFSARKYANVFQQTNISSVWRHTFLPAISGIYYLALTANDNSQPYIISVSSTGEASGTPSISLEPFLVTITYPVDGDQVPLSTLVKGTMNQQAPKGRSLWIVVQQGNRIWPQGVPTAPISGPDIAGLRWFAGVLVGSPNDYGKTFNIIALLTTSDIDQEFEA